MNPLLPWSIGLAALFAVCTAWQRRTVFSLSVMGAFWLFNTVFVVAGSLVLPLFPAMLRSNYYFLDWRLITQRDFIAAMAVSVVGSLLVLAGCRISAWVLARPPQSRPRSMFAVAGLPGNGLCLTRLAGLSVLPLIGLGLLVFRDFSEMVTGMIVSYSGNVPAHEMYKNRQFIGGNYPLVLLIFDILPFFALALAAAGRSGGRWFRAYGLAYQAVAVFFLLASIQKVPLMTVLIGLGLIHAVTLGGPLWRRWRPRAGAAGLAAGGAFLVTALGLLHMLTSRGRGFLPSMLDGILGVLGRISLGTPLLMAYYPKVEDFYGLTNVSWVARFLETDINNNTERVFRFFSHMTSGSCSFGAVVDFYGMAGWPGLAAGCLLLGGLLGALDAFIAEQPPGPARNLLAVLSVMFTVYLAQASVFNSLMGYGGLFFFIFWLAVRDSRAGRPAMVPALGRVP